MSSQAIVLAILRPINSFRKYLYEFGFNNWSLSFMGRKGFQNWVAGPVKLFYLSFARRIIPELRAVETATEY